MTKCSLIVLMIFRMSEESYFYGGNGEKAFTTGMKLECYICGEPVMVKIDQAEVDSIMREKKVGSSRVGY